MAMGIGNNVLDPEAVASFMGDENLKYPEGVQAPIYALLAAFALMASFITLPAPDEPHIRWVPNMLLSRFSVFAAVAAAWVWLETTTNSMDATPWPYILTVLTTAAILLVGIGGGALIGHIGHKRN